MSDILPSVSDAAVLEEEVAGRRIEEVDGVGRVGGLLRPPPNAVRDVVAGVFEEAIGDRGVPVVDLGAVEPPSRFGAAEVNVEARLTGGTFSTPFFMETGDIVGEASAGAVSSASIAVKTLS